MRNKTKIYIIAFAVLVTIGIIAIGIAYFKCKRVSAQEAVAREKKRIDEETQKIYKELKKQGEDI